MKALPFKKILILVVLTLLLVLGLSAYRDQEEVSPDPLEQELMQVGEISLTVEGLYENKTVEIYSNDTVLSVLERLNEMDNELALVTKEYSGLGYLVEDMAGMLNGEENKYWQYEVNGEMPQVGANNFVLDDNDKVRWHFSRSDF